MECKVLLLDSCPLVCEGLAHLIRRETGFVVCGAVGTASEAPAAVTRLKPDVLVLDIDLGHSDGLELIKALKTLQPGLRMLVASRLPEDQYAERVLRAGAQGFIGKTQPCSCVLHALCTVAAGGVWFSESVTTQLLRQVQDGRSVEAHCPLSDRELQVLRLIGSGLRTGKIAQEMGVSVKTIETYRERLKLKLKLADSTQLHDRARSWVENGCAECPRAVALRCEG